MTVLEEYGTNRAAAEEVGISESHLSLIMSGKRKPSLEVAERIAEAAGVTLDELARELRSLRARNRS